MKLKQMILRETALVAIGLLVCDVLEIVVFLLIKKYQPSVLFGTLYGTFFSVLNFFLMCLSIQKAMDKEEGQSAFVKRFYLLRMLLIIAVLVVSYLLPALDIIAACIPFLASKPVIYLLKLYETKKTAKENGGDVTP